MKKKLKLRFWVKVILVILSVLAIIWFIKWSKDQYNKCMEYTNNNTSICDKIK